MQTTTKTVSNTKLAVATAVLLWSGAMAFLFFPFFGGRPTATTTSASTSSTVQIYNLTRDGAGSGVASSTSQTSGIICRTGGSGICSEYASSSTQQTFVSFFATPDPGSNFVAWSSGPDNLSRSTCNSSNPLCIASYGNTSSTMQLATAIFESQDMVYEASTTVFNITRGSGTGMVTSMSPSSFISCSTDGTRDSDICSEDYDSPRMVALLATPDDGSRFVGWSGPPRSLVGPATDCNSSSPMCLLDIVSTSSVRVTAIFE